MSLENRPPTWNEGEQRRRKVSTPVRAVAQFSTSKLGEYKTDTTSKLHVPRRTLYNIINLFSSRRSSKNWPRRTPTV